MKKYLLLLMLLSVCLMAHSQSGDKWQDKVAPKLLQKALRGDDAAFLVLLYEQADISEAKWIKGKEQKAAFVYESLTQVANRSQVSVKSYLSSRHIRYKSLYIVNGLKVHGSLDLIQSLAKRTDVARLLYDEEVAMEEPIDSAPTRSESRSTIEWGIEMINADDVWSMGYRGQGVTVGGEDTGYDWTHPALIKQYRGYDAEQDTADHNYNWHDAIHDYHPANSDSNNICGLDVLEPCDDRGHGTHTMGTMIGLDGENEIGVAPEADWCGCRNMERGWGTLFSYIECFEWFLAPTDLNNENPDPLKAPHVINNSWTCPEVEGCDSSNFEIMNMVVNNLRTSGIVVVASAGNDGPGCSSISKPAAMFEGSFSVGATASNDTIAGFSSRGHVVADSSFRLKPNVSAPGVQVRSAKLGGGYNHSSGTSMAGPHVAGVVALIISANPDLAGEVDVIEDIIEQTAVPKTTDQECGGLPGSEIPNNTYGYGRIDALAAVEAALDLIETNTDENNKQPNVTVFPNPCHHELYIDLREINDETQIEIVDVHGKLVFSKKYQFTGAALHRIDMRDIPDGFYVYLIRSEHTFISGKVFKNSAY